MLRFSILFVLCLSFPLNIANALIYENLKPGVSTKPDADLQLGPPVKELVPGILYSYSVENEDLKALRVKFGNNGIIESIQLKFLESFPESQIKDWFDLGQADKYDYDVMGNKIAVYRIKGVLLQFEGPGDGTGVVGMSYIKAEDIEEKPVAEAGKEPQTSLPENIQVQQKDRTENYLGILFSFKFKNPTVLNTFHDSPARKAGIQMGDVLLEFNGRDLKNINPKTFTRIVQDADTGKPVKIKIRRNAGLKNFYVELKKHTHDQIKQQHDNYKKEAKRYFQQAQKQKRNDQYKAAAENYAKAMSFDPANNLHYDYQAYCLEKNGSRSKGYKLLETSLLLKDMMYNNYLYGMFLNNDEKFSMAIPYLEKATKKVERDGKYYYPFKELGYSKFMLDDYSGTIKTLNESVAMGDKSALTIGTLGYCYDKTGERQKAIDHYQRYLNMNSSDLNMNRLARTRLSKLKGSKKTINTGKSLFDAVDSILKEVQNAN